VLASTLAVLTTLLQGGSPPRDLQGFVFVDRNGNGTRDAGESGLEGVAVSDQDQVVRTGADGGWRIAGSAGTGLVFVSVPEGYRAVGRFWQPIGDGPISFALAPAPRVTDFSFVHASDTHISEASRGRTRLLKTAVDSIKPAFVIITGDLIRDALRVPEAEASGYYQLFQTETASFAAPVWTAPGNHEIFGIERHRSLVSPNHPLYGRRMYRHFRGPDYYSFNDGGIHFVALNTEDIDDLWYYGHVDSVQVAWLARDLAMVPATTPVVTFNHIPFFTSVETVNGYMDGPPAPTAITVRGKTSFRHVVSNAGEIIALITKGHPFPIALGGHMHVKESIVFAGVPTRFNQTAAIVGPSEGGGLTLPSGLTVYRVKAGLIDEGAFVRLP
jgi:Icc-related predicted phosphoesterase